MYTDLTQDRTAAIQELPRRSLRQTAQPPYRENSGGKRTPKSREPRPALVNAPKIPPRYCPAEVPSSLPPALENASTSRAGLANRFSPFLKQLCRSHLELGAERMSAINFAPPRDIEIGSQDVSNAASLPSVAELPTRPRVPDITEHISKRPRLNEGLQYSSIHIM